MLALAALFNPLRVWLQRRVDRLFYGSRRDPARALAEVGSRLRQGTSGTGLEDALAAVCQTLRVPSAAIRVNGTVLARVGESPSEPYLAPLQRGTEETGQLLIYPRAGEGRLPKADHRIVDLLADLLSLCKPPSWLMS